MHFLHLTFLSQKDQSVLYLIDIRSLIEDDYENFIRYENFYISKNKHLLEDKEAQYKSHTFPLGENERGNLGHE